MLVWDLDFVDPVLLDRVPERDVFCHLEFGLGVDSGVFPSGSNLRLL